MKKQNKPKLNRQICVNIDKKLESKIKKIMKELKVDSISKAVRACIDKY